MHLAKSTLLGDEEKAGVVTLWNAEYPEKLFYKDPSGFDDYLAKLQDHVHYLLLDNSLTVKAWAMTFTRENERWFAMIIAGSEQGKGHGTRLLEELKKDEPVLNAWAVDHDKDKKTNGEKYPSPLPFYLKNQFTVNENTRLNTPQLSAVKITWKK